MVPIARKEDDRERVNVNDSPSQARHFRHRWDGQIETGTQWMKSTRREGWIIVLFGSLYFSLSLFSSFIMLFVVNEGPEIELLIVILALCVPIFIVACVLMGLGIGVIRKPTQDISLKIDMDEDGFTKWVKGELLYSQIEGQFNDKGIVFERRRTFESDRLYRFKSGIKIRVSHGKSIVVDEDGEWPTIWVDISIERISIDTVDEARCLQGVLDDLPMFGYDEFTRADILWSPR